MSTDLIRLHLSNYQEDFDELQPGDLIFYSFTSNGRYKNFSHVVVYVGNGKVVEALNGNCNSRTEESNCHTGQDF